MDLKPDVDQQVEMRATIHITRAATGKVETYEIIGHTDPQRLAEIVAAQRGTKHHGTGGSLQGEGADLSNTPGGDDGTDT